MKKVDTNQKAIVKGLRAVGATVRSTASVGFGFPDLAVGWRGLTYLFEIKDGSKCPSQKRLTEAEQAFHDEWKGQVTVIETLEQALQTIGATSPR